MKRDLYGSAQRKLTLPGECHSVFRYHARADRNLDAPGLRMCKDESPCQRVAILVQRQLRRSLPFAFSASRARLDCPFPHAGDIVAQRAAREGKNSESESG